MNVAVGGAHRPLVGAAGHGRGRGQQPDAAVAAAGDGQLRGRRDDPDDVEVAAGARPGGAPARPAPPSWRRCRRRRAAWRRRPAGARRSRSRTPRARPGCARRRESGRCHRGRGSPRTAARRAARAGRSGRRRRSRTRPRAGRGADSDGERRGHRAHGARAPGAAGIIRCRARADRHQHVPLAGAPGARQLRRRPGRRAAPADAPGLELEVFAFAPGRPRRLPAARRAGCAAATAPRAPFDVVHAHFGLTAWPARAAPARAHAVTLHGTDLAHPRSRPITLAALPRTDLVGRRVRGAARDPAAVGGSRPRAGAAVRRRPASLPAPRPRAGPPAARPRPGRALPAVPLRPAAAREAPRPGPAGGRRDPPADAHRRAARAVPDYVNAANAVLIPSDREGFGLAVLEALACDVPVLATPVGIAPEVLGGVAGRPLRPVRRSRLAGGPRCPTWPIRTRASTAASGPSRTPRIAWPPGCSPPGARQDRDAGAALTDQRRATRRGQMRWPAPARPPPSPTARRDIGGVGVGGQLLHGDGDAAPQRIERVAALEHRSHRRPEARADVAQRGRHRRVAAIGHRAVGQRILGMGVEAGRDQQQLGSELHRPAGRRRRAPGRRTSRRRIPGRPAG